MTGITLRDLIQKMQPQETGPAPFDPQFRRWTICSAVTLGAACLVLFFLRDAFVGTDRAWLWWLALGLNIVGLGVFTWLWFETDGLQVGTAEHNIVARGTVALAFTEVVAAIVPIVIVIIIGALLTLALLVALSAMANDS